MKDHFSHNNHDILSLSKLAWELSIKYSIITKYAGIEKAGRPDANSLKIPEWQINYGKLFSLD